MYLLTSSILFIMHSIFPHYLCRAMEREPFSLTLVVVLVVVEALSRCMQKPSFSLAESAIALPATLCT